VTSGGSRTKRKWPRRIKVAGLSVISLAAILAACGCVYNRVASRRLARELAETPRDSATGLVSGIAPLDLNPDANRGVLLLHGFVGSPRDFGELPQRLSERGLRVRAPVLPGHGTRPTDMEGIDAAVLDRAVREEYERLRGECDKVAVVGFSMGSDLALRLVRDGAGPPPDALVLASPHFGVAYRWYAILSPALWARLMRPFVPYLVKGRTFVMVDRPEAHEDLYAYDVLPTSSVIMLNNVADDLWEDPPSFLPGRVLFIYAEDDSAASARRTRLMADRLGIAASDRVVLTESNHHVFHDYEREEAISRVEAFLADALGR